LPIHCENSNPEHYGPEGGLLDQKGGALFGYTDLYGGYDIITHRLPLSEVSHGYAVFKKREEDCVKVVLDPTR
jgi:threonine dehydrogenase-like Zn-dependent dehydrogenase